MSELDDLKISDLNTDNLLIDKKFLETVSIAVSFHPIVTGDGSYWHVRRYFFAHWIGMMFGPLLMACAPRSWKGINFGVNRNGKWSWVEIIR